MYKVSINFNLEVAKDVPLSTSGDVNVAVTTAAS